MQRKKTLGTSLATLAVLVCVLLGNVSASAHSAVPASYNCTSGCQSIQQWQGTTYGGKTTFVNDDPGFFTTNAYYMKWLRFDNANNAAHTDIGITKNHAGSNAPYCNNGDTKLQDFVYVWNADLSLQDHFCADVSSNDYNKALIFYGKPSFTCYSIFNEGDGVIDEWDLNGNCFDVEQTSYGRMNLYAKIQDSVSGHQVWGQAWNYNAWVDNNFAYHYQTVNPQVNTQVGAMRMYWQVLPASSTTGGTLYSCVYEFLEIPECTIGH